MTNIERQSALSLLRKYNQDSFHLRHAYTVEAVMRHFARSLGFVEEEEEFWGIVGLLHDVDFEKYRLFDKNNGWTNITAHRKWLLYRAYSSP